VILKGSQRSGGKQLGHHLLKTEENEHVEVHEVRGFVSDDLMGAMREAYALAKGTRCTQYLFSVSLNPPQDENVPIGTFEHAIDLIEERAGLQGQPRAIVFHEKEGRRHCHVVWSRIDAESMTAKPLPFFKLKLREVSKQLYLDHGWQMPKGLIDSRARDPKNFTLEEWQQAKRAGLKTGEVKGLIQECWAASDGLPAFQQALAERGLYLAKGDRRGHIAVTFEGEVLSIARMTGKSAKEVRAKLGEADKLPGVEDTIRKIGTELAPQLSHLITEAKRIAAVQMKPLNDQREALREKHAHERKALDALQDQRRANELKDRAARFRKGVLGMWDRLTGAHTKTKKQNELEAAFATERDRKQRDTLVAVQLDDRRELQTRIRAERRRHAEQVLFLYREAARYRLMRQGEMPRGREPEQPAKAPDGTRQSQRGQRGPGLER
jgi:hypothetical protein